jgi:prepilin-type processing-associated H-X9-DG protein
VQEQDQRGAWALPWTGASILAFDMHHDWDVIPYDPNHRPRKFVSASISFGLTQLPNCQGPNTDMLYKCPDIVGAQMERMPCAEWTEQWGYFHYLSAAPRSNHPDGVNAVFLDGSVHFLPNTIDEKVMAYLISANDNEPVDYSDLVE